MEIDEWRNGINLCIENVMRFYKDGELLLKNKSFGHACFSFITAFEEAAIAYFIMERFNDPQPKQLKDLFKHRRKLSLSSFKSAPIMTRDFSVMREYFNLIQKQLLHKLKPKNVDYSEEDIIELGKVLREQNSLMYLRNRSIYIRMNRSKTEFITPKEIKEETVRVLYIFLSIIIPELLVNRDLLFKFGSSSLEMIKYELQFTKAISNVIEISEILNEGSVEKLNETQAISLEDSDFFIELIMNREKYNLYNQDLLTDAIARILRPLANKFMKLMKKKEFKSQFEFVMKQLKIYNPIIAENTSTFYEVLVRISKNTFKIQDFPFLLELFKFNMK